MNFPGIENEIKTVKSTGAFGERDLIHKIHLVNGFNFAHNPRYDNKAAQEIQETQDNSKDISTNLYNINSPLNFPSYSSTNNFKCNTLRSSTDDKSKILNNSLSDKRFLKIPSSNTKTELNL